MYICICNSIKEEDFLAAAFSQSDALSIYQKLDKKIKCGQCVKNANCLLQQKTIDNF